MVVRNDLDGDATSGPTKPQIYFHRDIKSTKGGYNPSGADQAGPRTSRAKPEVEAPTTKNLLIMQPVKVPFLHV